MNDRHAPLTDTEATTTRPRPGGHGSHWVACAVVAVGVLLVSSWVGSPLVTGVGFALLVCPLTMGLVMWLLMRGGPNTPGARR